MRLLLKKVPAAEWIKKERKLTEMYRADIEVPGALVDRVLGDDLTSGIATGADDHDPLSKATRLAFESGTEVRGSVRISASEEVIGVISEYACAMVMGGQEVEPRELRAGMAWSRNVEEWEQNQERSGKGFIS